MGATAIDRATFPAGLTEAERHLISVSSVLYRWAAEIGLSDHVALQWSCERARNLLGRDSYTVDSVHETLSKLSTSAAVVPLDIPRRAAVQVAAVLARLGYEVA